jgi:hypothetical protein
VRDNMIFMGDKEEIGHGLVWRISHSYCNCFVFQQKKKIFRTNFLDICNAQHSKGDNTVIIAACHNILMKTTPK